MLTGQQTFVGKTVSDTLAFVLTKTPDLAILPATTPAQLRRLLRRSLEKERKARIPDIGIARIEIDDALTAPTTEATPAAPSLQVWQRPIPAAIVVLGVAAVASVAVWSLTRPTALRVARFPISLAADQTFTGAARPIVAISPDGSRVVYTANDSLWLRPVDQLQAVQVPGTEEARAPFFSADGQSIGFYADGQLKKVAVSGGAPVTLTDGVVNLNGASWGADDMILYGQPDGIWQVPGASGTPELVIQVGEGERILRPQMLPGGDWVLFTARATGQASWDEAQIVVQSVTTDERRVLIDGGRDGRYLPTGHLVYGLNNVLFAVPFDVGSRQVTGGPVPLVEGVTATRATGAVQFSVSSTGSLVYEPGSEVGDEFTLTWVDRDGNEEPLPAPPRAYDHPRVSPDGTRVAVDIADGDNTDIWIWDLERETPTQLTFDEGVDDFPLWTPDSARVVFQSSREGGGAFWKAADGTGQVEPLKDGLARPSAWAADGRLIFEQRVDLDIGVLTMEGERTVEMLLEEEFVEAHLSLSPDGRWLAYVSNETGDPLIYVKPFPNIDDGLWRVSPDFGVHPMWSPDGRELFYRSRTDFMVAQIETEPTFSPRIPEPLFSLLPGMIGSAANGRRFDIEPNGDRFIVRARGADAQTGDEPFNGLIFVDNWFEELRERVPVS